jgi:hypothetical protein
VNVLRGQAPAAINARKARCHRGHRFEGQHADGRRRCLVCDPLRPGAGTCDQCGSRFTQSARGRVRRFCSDQCRDDHHNARRRVDARSSS